MYAYIVSAKYSNITLDLCIFFLQKYYSLNVMKTIDNHCVVYGPLFSCGLIPFKLKFCPNWRRTFAKMFSLTICTMCTEQRKKPRENKRYIFHYYQFLGCWKWNFRNTSVFFSWNTIIYNDIQHAYTGI